MVVARHHDGTMVEPWQNSVDGLKYSRDMVSGKEVGFGAFWRACCSRKATSYEYYEEERGRGVSKMG